MSIIQITQDSELRQSEPDTNFGGDLSVKVSQMNGQNSNMVIGFDLSAIPAGSQITQANLTLTNVCRNGVDVMINPILTSWNELQVTWNTPWTTPGGDFNTGISVNTNLAGQAVPTVVDIIPLIQFLINSNNKNAGVIIRAVNPNTEAQIYTREGPNSQPALDISFTAAITPSALIDKGYNEIVELPNSDFFQNHGAVAKNVFKVMSDTSKTLISHNLKKPAKVIIQNIIQLMDGSGYDLLINPASQAKVRPYYEQAKAGL